MEQSLSLEEIIKAINIDSSCCYILLVVALSIIIRLILCFFKAKAIVKGEIAKPENEAEFKDRDIKSLIKESFLSNSGDIRIDDHWLPFFIGIIELVVFPFFMTLGYWKAIIGWIGIKALSTWGGRNTRTAYNRFLFGNILSLIASIIIAITCIN
ncbi:MAG: hypothetical protein JW743_01470 [Deltaproteobacteria bacterium]|nr:hypothetical protein [Deltaproteobacteria bacterium]